MGFPNPSVHPPSPLCASLGEKGNGTPRAPLDLQHCMGMHPMGATNGPYRHPYTHTEKPTDPIGPHMDPIGTHIPTLRSLRTL